MKVIIAGSRSIGDYDAVCKAIDAFLLKSGPITEVVSGRAAGVDSLGEMYARQHNVPVKLFPPEWKKHGKKAGFLRNEEMADYADALIAVWDGASRGTQHMMDQMTKRGKPILYSEIYHYPLFIPGDE